MKNGSLKYKSVGVLLLTGYFVLGGCVFAATDATSSELQAEIECGLKPVHRASEMLLGQNLEACLDTIPGMLSERLDNAKFLGPADPITGIAPGWRPNSDAMNLMRCEMTPGAGMTGHTAQLVQNFDPNFTLGILQNNLKLRAGEKFDVEIWVRAWNSPVTLKLGLLPLASRLPPYSEAGINVDTSYYKCYRVTLAAPATDNEAAFYCAIQGKGIVWIDQIHMRPAGEGPLCKDLVERMATMRVPVLRFPGGVVSTAYRWRYGTGPVPLRPVMPDPSCKKTLYYDFGTDEYLALCQQQGILPQITVNLGFGTPEEAGEWAAYCADWYKKKGLALPPIYFQIGNHPYLAAELAHMTPEMYVRALREYVPIVRQNYPGARIIAVSPLERDAWRSTLLDQAGQMVDLIALQGYAGQPTQMAGTSQQERRDEDALSQMKGVVNGVTTLIKGLEGAIEDCRKRDLKARVAFTEWNLWGQASHRDGKNFYEPYDVQHGLFAASMIIQFIRLAPDLELANFYHLVNPMGIFIHRGPEVEETCMPEIFRMFRPGLPGDVLPLKIQSPMMGDLPVVDGALLSNNHGKWLYLVNRHPSKSVTMKVHGINLAKAKVTALVGENPFSQFQHRTLTFQGEVISLPALSFVCLHEE